MNKQKSRSKTKKHQRQPSGVAMQAVPRDEKKPDIPPPPPADNQPGDDTRALVIIHFLESAHCGSGTSGNGVQNQIQREAITGWPTIRRRSLKGAIRGACVESVFQSAAAGCYEGRNDANRKEDKIKAAFGPAEVTGNDDGQSGAVRFSPATMLAFPVCSYRGVFAWVTCPEVFQRLYENLYARHMEYVWPELTPIFLEGLPMPEFSKGEAFSSDGAQINSGETIRLGDLTFKRVSPVPSALDSIVTWFDSNVRQDYMPEKPFTKRLVMVSNEAFGYLVRYATEKVMGNSLDLDSKTVEESKLFSSEYLPQQSLMYSVVQASDEQSSREGKLNATDLCGFVKNQLQNGRRNVIQFGGEQSKDCGIASLRWVHRGQQSAPRAEGES